MKKTTLFIVLAALCLNFNAKSQRETLKITGTILDENGLPIPTANISVRGSKKHTSSNAQGVFQLEGIPVGSILIISSNGYKSQTLQVKSSQNIGRMMLVMENNQLEEVQINAGYYTITEKQRTGNIASLKAATIAQQPVNNPLEALHGRIAGVYIQQSNGNPGSNISVQIRGKSSVTSGNNPLYIIDGVPFDAQGLSSELSASSEIYGIGGYSPLNGIPPEDIQSIEILKDADATAIYGSRGSNGVVLITTKKGSSGKTKIDLSLSIGASKVTRKLDMMNTQQFLDMRKQAFAIDKVNPKATDYDLNGKWDQTRYTNWQDVLVGGTAAFNTIKIGFSGGDQLNQFLLSGNYQRQGTVYPGKLGYERMSAHYSSTHHSANHKFKVNFSALYSVDQSNWMNADLTSRSISLQPNAPALYKADGSLNWENSTFINPLRELEKKYLGNNGNLVANSLISYTPIPALEFKASLGYNDRRLNDKSYIPSTYFNPAENKTAANASANFNTSSAKSWIIEPQVNYQKQTRFGTFNLLAGTSFQRNIQDQQILQGIGFPSDALIADIQAATKLEIRNYNSSIYKYTAVYGRINYSIGEQYFLNLTGRRDGSSRFGPGRQFANFGAIGAAWLFTEQHWIKNQVPFISYGKIRTSYGTSGNDQIGDYEYLSTYQAYGAYNGISGLYPVRLLNPDFGWELNKKFEIGVDLGFFNDRVRTGIAYYRNRSSSQLIDYPLAATTGFTSIRDNLDATVQNTGLELELNSTLIRKNKLKWQSSLNLTIPCNKLIAFPLLANSSYADQYVIGRPLTIRKVLNLKGVNPQTGLFEYEDINQDGEISLADDRKTVMNIAQTLYGGLSNSITYQQLQLDFLFQFVKQRASSFRYNYASVPGRTANQPEAYIGQFWTESGDQSSLQRLSSGANFAAVEAYSNYAYSNASVEDASFIRLKNVSLSYNLKLYGRSLSIYAQGQNLLTITKYFGLDPENATLSLPPLRTLSFGIRLNP